MDDEITPPSTPGALDQLAASEYQSLRELTRRLRRRGSREPDPETESLVHEVYVRYEAHGNESWNDRTHFLAVAALQLRHVLVDLARAARAQKRGATTPASRSTTRPTPTRNPWWRSSPSMRR
jgi:hypothetical protein